MFHPEREELAHYFRFHELAIGRHYRTGDSPISGPTGEPLAVDWTAVHATRVNPHSSDLAPDSPARHASDRFNSSYCTVLQLLEQCFNGRPTLLQIATGAMYGIRQQMIDLMALPSGDGVTAAGPSFEWIPPERRIFDATAVAVIPHGPYLVTGDIEMYDAVGELHLPRGVATLCRCGGSHTKPFCDGTHARLDFDGTETATHDQMADRRRAYPTRGGVTIFDDRTRCAHFGQCTGRLPAVFGVADDAFVAPERAPSADITAVVGGCPSGALTYAASGSEKTVETHEGASVHPIVDGPYQLRGGVPVVSADGRPYETRERQTLCRCGKSRNKPFCDGSHWYAGFRDPLPPELQNATTFPWDDADSAERGRRAYAVRTRRKESS